MDIFKLFMNQDKECFNLYPDLKLNYNTKQKVILIHGGVSSGKTLYALETIMKNKDKAFLYIDAFFTANLNFQQDNTLVFQTNVLDDVIDCISSLEKDILDCIIIDGISSITSSNDDWNYSNLRYEEVNEYIYKIITICAKKNIMLILINTDNAKGVNANLSNKLKEYIHVIIKLSDGVRHLNKFSSTLLVEKNLLGTKENKRIEFNLEGEKYGRL